MPPHGNCLPQRNEATISSLRSRGSLANTRRRLTVDLDDPAVLVDLPVGLEALRLAPPDVEIDQGFGVDFDATPAARTA